MQRHDAGEVREPGGGGGVDGLCLASGSFVWSDRGTSASCLWNSAVGINLLNLFKPQSPHLCSNTDNSLCPGGVWGFSAKMYVVVVVQSLSCI